VQFAWEIALSIYGDIFQKTPEARRYLQERRLSKEVIRKYRFGYCPTEGSPLLAAAGMRRLTRQDLETAGLYRKFYAEDGQALGSYEFLKGRLVFADADLAHNPVYLVGRALPGGGLKDSAAKYLGLAGFQKPLFGYRTLGSGEKPVFLLEGPLDKLTLESWGYDAVALMAANPSPEQIRLLQSLNRPIVPIGDNDEAGQAALSIWQEAIPWLQKPLQLPEQVDGMAIKDPNDLAAKLPEGVGQKLFTDRCKRLRIG
jgi:DNA primase